jgi:hypothetical protein
LIGGALAALLSSTGRVMAKEKDDDGRPGNPFILLLKGLYRPVPVGHGPGDNLGLSTVNLSDGSFSRTRIHPVFRISERADQDEPIGTFYVQFGGNLCAYDLPGGALGGHNHMVDRLHQLAGGSFDEFCFCNISQYQFP